MVSKDVFRVQLPPGGVEFAHRVPQVHAISQCTKLCSIPVWNLHLCPVLYCSVLLQQQGLALPCIIPKPEASKQMSMHCLSRLDEMHVIGKRAQDVWKNVWGKFDEQ